MAFITRYWAASKKGLLAPTSLALLSGVLTALAFPTFHLHFLAWLALVPLFHAATRNPDVWHSARLFFIAGLVSHLIILQWLLANIFWAGGWAILGYVAMCVALTLYWAVCGATWAWVRRTWPGAPGLFSIIPLWGAMEFLQARLFTGFGWSAMAYTQTGNLPVLQWAAVGGVGLLTAFLILSNVLWLLLLTQQGRGRWRAMAGLLGLVLLVTLGGNAMLGTPEENPARPPLQVGLFQSNYSQEMKWDNAFILPMVEKAGDYTRRLVYDGPRPDLVVWPEALVMKEYERPDLLESLQQTARDAEVFLYTGAARKRYNSSVLFDPEGAVVDFYDKVHLAPFGEYVPMEPLLPFLRAAVPGQGVEHGEAQKVLPVQDRVMGPLICFEVLFAPMAAHLRAEGADFLTVITNLAWFGGSNAIAQELEIARMRAVETRLPLVHAANTGISGVFDPWGRFTPVNRVWDSEHQAWRHWDPAMVRPENLMMRRAAGVIALPEKAAHPLPWGATLINLVLLFLAIGFVLGALFMQRRKHNT